MLNKLWPAIAWGLVIFIIISIPGNFVPKVQSPWSLIHFDKLVHTGIFFVFSFLLMRGFYLQYKSVFLRSNYVLIAIAVGIVFGLITELWQGIINTERMADVYDFIADSAGSIIAWPVFLRIKSKLI